MTPLETTIERAFRAADARNAMVYVFATNGSWRTSPESPAGMAEHYLQVNPGRSVFRWDQNPRTGNYDGSHFIL